MSWNRGAERIFGYRSSEPVARNITFIVPEDRADEEAMILNEIRHGRRVEPFETVRIRKDGQPNWWFSHDSFRRKGYIRGRDLAARRTLDAGFWFAPTRRQLCNRFRQSLSRRSGQAGAVFQRVKPWNSQAPTHGKFWVDVPGGDRKQKTILLGPCATRTIACRRLRLHLDQSGVNSKQTFNESTVPATTFKQQAE